MPDSVTTTPALPCHQCGKETSTSRIEPRDAARWLLVPVCSEHRLDSLGR